MNCPSCGFMIRNGGKCSRCRMKFVWIFLIVGFLVWQGWEEYHYGDDARINIFSTGDYKRILHE